MKRSALCCGPEPALLVVGRFTTFEAVANHPHTILRDGPVLSEQITVVEPTVSQATSWRTRQLARVILRHGQASDTVDAHGQAFRTATTTMITMYMKYSSN